MRRAGALWAVARGCPAARAGDHPRTTTPATRRPPPPIHAGSPGGPDENWCRVAGMLAQSSARSLQVFRGAFDRLADTYIGAAAAQISAHRPLDIRVRRLAVGLEECDRAHDLSALAVPALHDITCHPGVLHRAAHGIPSDALNGDDRPVTDQEHRQNTRACSDAGDVHRTSAAGTDSTPVFRAGHLELFTQDPQQR